MERTKNSKVLAVILTMCMLVSVLSGLSVSTSALTAIEVIQGYAADDNAAVMSIVELDATGVTAVSTIDANLTAYRTAVELTTPVGVDSTAKIQTLVDNVNLAQAIAKIEGYNVANNANAMIIAELTAAGVTGTKTVNLPEYKVAVAGAAAWGADTTTEIQTLITNVNTAEATTAFVAIEAYGVGAASLTIDQLDKAGVVGLVTGNLDTAVYGYKVKIGDAAVGAANTIEEIQALIDATNVKATEVAQAAAENARLAAIETIKGYAADDSATGLTEAMLKTAGVIGVLDATLTANLALYKTAIAAKTPVQVDTTAKIQAIVDGINAQVSATATALAAALTAISGYAANDNADTLTIPQLTAAGVTGLVDVNLPEYKAAIAGKTPVQVDTTSEIQAIIDGVDAAQATAAITAIDGYTTVTVSALTIEQLIKAGVVTVAAGGNTPAIAANLTRYKTAIGGAVANTIGLIQGFVNTANSLQIAVAAAIANIEAYTAGAATLTNAELVTAEVTGTIDDAAHLVAYKIAIGAAAVGAADTTAEIQAIINTENIAVGLAAAINYISVRAGAANAITSVELAAAGVTGAIAANNAEYQAAIALSTAALTDTKAEIQTLVNNVHTKIDTVLTIKGYAANDDAQALTIEQLLSIGITGTKTVNLDAYKTDIAAATATNASTVTAIQLIITNTNNTEETNAIAAIDLYTAVTVSGLTINQLIKAGVVTVAAGADTPAIEANLARYKTAIGGADASTKGKIQAFVNAANISQMNAAVLLIQGYAANDDAIALTISKLSEAGVVSLIDANLSFYKSAIAASTLALTSTTAQIQTIVTTVNAAQVTSAIAAIEAYTPATVTALTIEQLVLAGVTPATAIAANLAAYKVAIGNAVVLAADDLTEIQLFVTNVNTAEALIAAIAVISGYAANDNATALTNAQIVAAGVTTSIDTVANLAEYKIAIAASTAALTDTTAEIKAIIDTANIKVATIVTIEAYSGANALTIEQLTIVGVTGTIAANLTAYQTAVGAAAVGAADSTTEIQAIIITVNTQQVAAAIAAISGYAANDDASLLTIAKLEAAGVTGAILVNLGAHNAVQALSTGYIGVVERATAAGADEIVEIQALIDSANQVLSSAAISGVNVGSVVGSVPAGSSDPTYIPTFTIAIPASVTSFLKTNFTVTGSGVVTMYTSNDFTTGMVGAEGVSIVENSTVVYVKVVSANGISTKYYKVILNVVDATKKYTISKTEFVPAGSNFLATVTLTRGQAVMLANPKLLLTYTLADGETQVFLTQNALEGANEVVVGAGVMSVSAVLVDGNVDWSAGSPVAKSAYVTMTVPVL